MQTQNNKRKMNFPFGIAYNFQCECERRTQTFHEQLIFFFYSTFFGAVCMRQIFRPKSFLSVDFVIGAAKMSICVFHFCFVIAIASPSPSSSFSSSSFICFSGVFALSVFLLLLPLLVLVLVVAVTAFVCFGSFICSFSFYFYDCFAQCAL